MGVCGSRNMADRPTKICLKNEPFFIKSVNDPSFSNTISKAHNALDQIEQDSSAKEKSTIDLSLCTRQLNQLKGKLEIQERAENRIDTKVRQRIIFEVQTCQTLPSNLSNSYLKITIGKVTLVSPVFPKDGNLYEILVFPILSVGENSSTADFQLLVKKKKAVRRSMSMNSEL